LQDIDKANWKFAHRLFQTVAVAARPLRVEELAEFLVFDFDTGPTPMFHAGWRPEDPADAVLSTSSSLLAVVKSGDSTVIQFSHFSVKEFLTSTRLVEANNTISRYHVSLTPAHTLVVQACLGILLCLDENITRHDLKDFPLAEYAARHWVDHARFERVSPSTQDDIQRLFDPRKPHLSVWVWIYDPEIDSWHPSMRPERPSRPRGSSLHYAAICGLHDLMPFLVIKCLQDVNAPGFDDDATPLHLASRRAHVGVAQVLLHHGADANSQDNFKSTPLHLAAEGGHLEATRVLLANDADTSARDDFKSSPLHLASEGGHVEVVRVLLEHGANVNAKERFNSTPLRLALDEGHVEVAFVLLEHGADASPQGVDSWDPLNWALQRRHGRLARVLLEHSADASSQNTDKRTSWHFVSKEGHVEAVQILLECGADVSAKDMREWTPLHLASKRGYVDLARVLIEHGADASSSYQDIDKQTSLHFASQEGHVELAQVLLEHGADVSAQDVHKWTPLHFASERGHAAFALMLLEHGADPNAQNVDVWTPLLRRVLQGRKVTQDDLKRCVPVRAKARESALRYLWRRGRYMYKLLRYYPDATYMGDPRKLTPGFSRILSRKSNM
jgi:ankyrin repeat protein